MAKRKLFSINNDRILIGILILIMVFLALYIFLKKTPNQFNQNGQSTISKCPQSGIANKQDYLRSYTVKGADSLLSIAKSELGSTSRINEIVELNKDRYPSINNISPFLEIGWILYLPPVTINSSSGKLEKISGIITRKDDAYWSINLGNGTESIPSYLFKNIQDKDSFNVGDCVTLLDDVGNGVVLYILKQ